MIVTNTRLNPFQQKSISQGLKSTRAINPGNGNVQVIKHKPMTSRRTIRRTQEKVKEEKCLDDFEFKSIDIKWSVDYDILEVHERVMDFLVSKAERQETITKTIQSFKSHKNPNMSAEEVSSLLNKIQKLEKQYDKLERISVLDYVISTQSLIDEYKTLTANDIKVFGKKSTVNVVNKNKKTRIVEKYFEICVDFCPMKVTRYIVYGSLCDLCSGIIEDKGEKYVCSQCHTVQNKTEIPSEKIDLDDSYSNKANYQRSIRDDVLCFEGKSPVVIPKKIIEIIRNAIKSYQDFDIKKMTKYDLYKIMKEKSLGNWYKHINKIYSLLTGIPPPNISKYESNIFKRGELFNRIYDEIKGDSRTNFIHGLYLLWLFLKNEGYHPDIHDFVMLKGRDVEVNNLDIVKKGFDILSETNPDMEWKIYQIP